MKKYLRNVKLHTDRGPNQITARHNKFKMLELFRDS